MPSSVYLDVNNYTTSEYAVGTSGFVCNYPVQQDVWGESDNIAISITQGEKLVTIDSGLKDFTALLQGDQGVLLYPFISNGFENFILELDYVIDATTAMLKMPFFHPTISGAVKWVAINTLAQPVLASTTVGNTDSFQANYAYATPYNNSELSYIGSGQKISVGTSPYIVQVESTLLFMLLKFN